MIQFFKFACVGLLGTAINLLIYYLTSSKLELSINSSAIIAFIVAVTSNFLLNNAWTFNRLKGQKYPPFFTYVHYVLGNIKGLVVNLIGLNLCIFFIGIEYHLIAQLIGIFLGMFFNFFYIRKFVFN